MTHTQLVQTSTDLLFAAAEPERFLAQYDLALASETDSQLSELVSRLQREQDQSHQRMAA